MKTALIHSDAYKRFDYGPEHPLRMERLGLTFGLMDAYGLTRLPGTEVLPPAPAPEAALREFHADEYLAVLRAAGAGEAVREAAPVRPWPRRQSDLARGLRGLRARLRRLDPRGRAGGAGRRRAGLRLRGGAPPRDAGPRVRILLPERRGARDPGAPSPRPARGLRRHRRASRRRRAGGVLPERRRADDLHARARRPPVPGNRGRRGDGRGPRARVRGEPAAEPLHRRRGLPRRVRRGRPSGAPRLRRGRRRRPARHRRASHGSADAPRALGRRVRGGRAAASSGSRRAWSRSAAAATTSRTSPGRGRPPGRS